MCTVSVLVPVYNVAPYIRKCVDSILNQTFTDFELILCDDGSTDESGKICDEYAQKDARVQVIHKKNEGNAPTRRVLLEQSTGDYVLYVDSDDWIHPETLERTVGFARKTDSGIVMFKEAQTDNDGKIIKQIAALYPDESVFFGENLKQVYRDFMSGNALNHLWGKLIARCLLSDGNERNPIYQRHMNGEDKLQLIPVFEQTNRFAYLDRSMYFYRMSQGGMGRNFRLNYFADSRIVTAEMLRFVERRLGSDDKEKLPVYRHYLESLSTQLMSCVHSRTYTFREMKDAFREGRQSKVYRSALESGAMIHGSALNHGTLWLFRYKADTLLILMLRLEQRIMGVLRTVKSKKEP